MDIPLKKFAQRRGAQTELSRIFDITPGAINQMVKSGRVITVVTKQNKPVVLREEKVLAIAG